MTHILTNCSIVAGINCDDPANRMTFRHNCILWYIVHEISNHTTKENTRVFADLPEHVLRYNEIPSHLRIGNSNLRPDIIIESDQEVVIGELTSPMVWNMVSSNVKKTKKYEDELRPRMKSNKPLKIQTFEVSARGLVGLVVGCEEDSTIM